MSVEDPASRFMPSSCSSTTPGRPPFRTTAIAVPLLAGLLVLAGQCAAVASEVAASPGIRLGDGHFNGGRVERAISAWTDALHQARAEGAVAEETAILGRRAEGYQSLGYHRKSIADLKRAIALARSSGDRDAESRLRGSLGTVLHLSNELEPDLSASEELEFCLRHARGKGDDRLAAQTLNNLGNLLSERDPEAALARYEEGQELARRAGARGVEATSRLNAVRVALDGLEGAREKDAVSSAASDIEARLAVAETSIRALPDSAWKARALVTVGREWMRLAAGSEPRRSSSRRAAGGALRDAARVAHALEDVRNLSYALGFLGSLAEVERRLAEGIQLTRRALFHAREVRALELEYRWHWQLGRLLRTGGDRAGAIAAYTRAVGSVRALRQDLLRGGPRAYAAFRRDVAPMFFQLADLHLEHSQQLDAGPRQAALRGAVGAIEEFKAASIEYFYEDECVARLEATARSVGQLSQRAAAVYPIMLADRLEVVVELPQRLTRHTIPVGRKELVAAIDAFLVSLGRPSFARFRSAGARLYDWLLAPVEAALQSAGVDTLVFVLHDELATVPLSALYDCDAGQLDNDCDGHRARSGHRGAYLVEKYAVAVAPGLTLLDARPIAESAGEALLIGLAEGVQGFQPLEQVEREIAEIGGLLGGEILMNAAFTRQRVKRELEARPFTVVHIASHAQFRADARSSFVVAYDSKLSMNDLESLMNVSRFRDRPVELLTLSACETAVGDELAALGLAGIAVKAGARSALASLWAVDDAATAVLIPEFYRQLRVRNSSKAGALQRAQIQMLRSERAFSHPRFWAPFLMIGNWL